MMACASEEVVSVPLMVKLNKISSYLSSFQAEKLSFKRKSLPLRNADNQPEGTGRCEANETILSQQQNETVTASHLTSDKINVYYCTDVPVTSKRPLDNFRCRLKTFGDVCWMFPTKLVSVYECVRRGWYLLQQDMLCCCSCNEMVCLQLPPSHSSSYEHAVSILRDRVLNKHKGNCRYRNLCEPVSMSRPPSLLTTPHLYSLAAAAHQLASRASCSGVGARLPYLEDGGRAAMERLGVSSSLLQEVWGSVCGGGWQHVAVLLALCGWKATTVTDTIRCELCQRNIGLWHFMSYAEHEEREEAAAAAASVLSERGQQTIETTDIISSEAGPDGNSQAGPDGTSQAGPDGTSEAGPDGTLESGPDGTSEAGPDSTSNNCQTMTEDIENLHENAGEESSATKPGDELVAANTEGSVIREIVKEGTELADTCPQEDAAANESMAVEDSAASVDPTQARVVNADSDRRETSISNEDQPNNIAPSSAGKEETETGKKRKRSECEDGSMEEDQSKPVSETGEESSEALPSKRSKSDEDNPASCTREPLPGNPVVSVEESSSTATVSQVPSKPLFCPFSQHRYWCGWVTSQKEHLLSTGEAVASTNSPSNGGSDTSLHAQDTISEAVGGVTGSTGTVPLDTLPGYDVFARQLKSVLQLAQGKQWTTSDKYATTIEGLRSVRAHLSSWAK